MFTDWLVFIKHRFSLFHDLTLISTHLTLFIDWYITGSVPIFWHKWRCRLGRCSSVRNGSWVLLETRFVELARVLRILGRLRRVGCWARYCTGYLAAVCLASKGVLYAVESGWVDGWLWKYGAGWNGAHVQDGLVLGDLGLLIRGVVEDLIVEVIYLLVYQLVRVILVVDRFLDWRLISQCLGLSGHTALLISILDLLFKFQKLRWIEFLAIQNRIRMGLWLSLPPRRYSLTSTCFLIGYFIG